MTRGRYVERARAALRQARARSELTPAPFVHRGGVAMPRTPIGKLVELERAADEVLAEGATLDLHPQSRLARALARLERARVMEVRNGR